jgi:c-di-GMP-related signal transduction protein
MVNLLCDLHIAEGAAELLEGTKKDSILKIYYTQIFEIQGIEEKQFKKDLDLLKEDPTEMTKVYKWVNDSLAARSKRIQSGGYSPN